MYLDEIFNDKPKEECGVFGIVCNDEPVSYDTYLGLFSLQHRGQESAGIVVGDGESMEVKRSMGLVVDVFKDGLPELKGDKAIGHVRYSTAGASVAVNTQPLKVTFSGGNIAVANNGSLTNYCQLKERLSEKGAIFHTATDSEVILNAITFSDKATIEDKVVDGIKMLKGAFCLVIMTDKKLIAVRDEFGFHPLCIGKMPNGWVVASESCALDAVGAKFVRDVEPGEVIIIEKDKADFKSFYYTEEKKEKAHCIFEYIYFARVDSVIDKQSVYMSRVAMGRQLAIENPDIAQKADVVISVPDTGTPIAIGFGLESGVPFLEGLNKNRYVGRTFIQPTQEKRDTAVRMKLNPTRSVVEGKSVIMVDDSIVRGTTSGKIVRLLKDAGAKQVHMLVSSPPILYPCYFGVDTAVRKELIAVTHTLEQIREYISADSLRFLSEQGLKNSVDKIKSSDMCYACFNAKYPVRPDLNEEEERILFAKANCNCLQED